MSSFYADENSIVRLSPNLDVEHNPEDCIKAPLIIASTSAVLFTSPDRNSIVKSRLPTVNDERSDSGDEQNEGESLHGAPSSAERASSPEGSTETESAKKQRENAESEQLAWEMMREESMSAYRMQMDFINSSSNEMSAEDLEAIQMAMGGGNGFADIHQDEAGEVDEDGDGQDQDEEQDENQDSDIDQWDYDRLLALGEVIGGKFRIFKNTNFLG